MWHRAGWTRDLVGGRASGGLDCAVAGLALADGVGLGGCSSAFELRGGLDGGEPSEAGGSRDARDAGGADAGADSGGAAALADSGATPDASKPDAAT